MGAAESEQSGRFGRTVAIACLVAILLSLPGSAGSARDPNAEGRLDRSAAGELVALVNAARAARSLPVLAVNEPLTLAAEAYAEGIGQEDWFDHVGPDGSTIVQRAERAGYLGWAYLGENLARGSELARPADVIAGWMDSPGHRENLLSTELQEIGVGCYMRARPEPRFWCVQAFGGKS